MTLSFIERMATRLLLRAKLGELHDTAFEEFFHNLMSTRYFGFVDVRTAGRLGDIGSDGLLLHDRKLYACYGPQVFDSDRVATKLDADLTKALEKRAGQFDAFVFVHNDLRGVHPLLSTQMSTVSATIAPIRFELFGSAKFRDELVQLSRQQVEDVLGVPIPVEDLAYKVPMEEVMPLLDFLAQKRQVASSPSHIAAPSAAKLDYARFTKDTREELRRDFHLGADIEKYYEARLDPTERDEVAASFQQEYVRLRYEYDDPDIIVFHLEQYILGNAAAPVTQRRGALAVIGFFFQACDIFQNAPPGWHHLTHDSATL